MKNKFIPTISIIILFFIFSILYKGLQNTNIYEPKVENNIEIPIFKAKTLYGDLEINSLEFFKKDKFYLLNIWASWCVPCRDEHPQLMNLSKIKRIEVIGLNYKDKIANAKSFLKDLKNPFNIVFLDNDGTISIEWGAYGVPESFLIYNNVIIKKIIGPITENSLQEIISLIE
ncbi:DsbE family thiol:disulfide interchange protein [Candidatus Pelagibacter sp.]|nr:DsbE family thiol:disulfide interchange protein [Candidatus Pelagibacter sp.]|tara:strand:+ start:178 stop:696 length:519 start_codon:yes stop_codon:yes gene_type:complete